MVKISQYLLKTVRMEAISLLSFTVLPVVSGWWWSIEVPRSEGWRILQLNPF